ncbi:MAG: glycosyltransferase [Elusimicrobiaceae bacterium]|nr:glycosyltransferase [Elusimicrobiaceae bacterium]
MNRLLLIGPDFYGYTNNIAAVFKSNGWTVTAIQVKLKTGSFYRRQDAQSISAYNLQVTETARSGRFDHIIVVKGEHLFESTLKHLKQAGTSVFLFLQDSCRGSITGHYLKYFDKILTFEDTDTKYLKSLGYNAIFFGAAVSPDIYYPQPDIIKDIDICFVGHFSEGREDILWAIINQFRNFKIAIGGHYLGRHPKYYPRWIKYYLQGGHKYFLNRDMTPSEVCNLYNRTKICLNLIHTQSVEGFNPRLLEIAATKSFQLCSANAILEREYKRIGVDIFHSNAEMYEKIEFYLNNSKESEKLADLSYKIALENTYNKKITLLT